MSISYIMSEGICGEFEPISVTIAYHIANLLLQKYIKTVRMLVFIGILFSFGNKCHLLKGDFFSC